jgi:hypothetical protein
MVNLMHELQQTANFAFWEAFPREPVEVISGQVCDEYAFVFSKRHGQAHKAL